MPRVKVTIRTMQQIPSRRRAGLVIMPGVPNEFDITDEQLEALEADALLDVTVLGCSEPTGDGSGDTSDKNDAGEELNEANVEAEADGEAQEATSETQEETSAVEIPKTEAAIKKQPRHVVVEQAKSLGIDLDYDNEVTVTKTVMAKAIVAKRQEV